MCLGCADTPDTVQLEVYSWWQVDSESEAFEAVRRIHRQEHGVDVENLARTNSTDARSVFAERMLAKNPPATFLANAGANLLGWTVFDTQRPDEFVDQRQSARWIEPLSELFDQTGLHGDDLRDGLREHLVAGGEPFAVPINIHRLNVIYYNRLKLEEFQGRTGKSFVDLETLCPEGEDYDPWSSELDLNIQIAIGTDKHKFTIALLTLENVLPAIARRNRATAEEAGTFYDSLLRGTQPGPRDETGGSEDVREAFRCVQYLSQWFIRDPREDGWAEAAERVSERFRERTREEPAAFTVMGDWANGVLAAELDDSVLIEPFPGTDELFVFTADTFPLPIGTLHRPEVMALLETIASPDAQVAFSEKKGSIPAHREARPDSLEQWQQRAIQAYDTRTERERLLANSGYFPSYYPEVALQDALLLMTAWNVVRRPVDDADRELLRGERLRTLEDALRIFTEAEPILAHWQSRLADGPSVPIEP